MNCEACKLLEAQKDYLRWKKHVREKRRRKNDPDLFKTFEAAKTGAKSLLTDFSTESEDSVITIFKTENENYKIDAISNNKEFELHSEEYEGEDVVGIVFYRKETPFVKKMKSQV